jgi:hypothetical protein
MTVGFVGFMGAAPGDLYFKIVVNVLAVVSMAALGCKVRRGQGGSGWVRV